MYSTKTKVHNSIRLLSYRVRPEWSCEANFKVIKIYGKLYVIILMPDDLTMNCKKET